MGSEAPKEKIDTAVEDMKLSLNMLEEKFLQNKPFIVGNKISVADLVAVVDIMQVIIETPGYLVQEACFGFHSS